MAPSLHARQGLLIQPEEGTALYSPGQILTSLPPQVVPSTNNEVPTNLMFSVPQPTMKTVPTTLTSMNSKPSHVRSSHAPQSTAHKTISKGADEGPAPFKVVYLTPLFVLVGLFLIFSIGGKVWGSAWRSKQREIRRRRKHHQNLEKDMEQQALDPDSSADGPHAVITDEDGHDHQPSKRLRERRSELNLVPDNGSTGLLHAFGARVLGTKGQLLPPTTRDRAGNKYSMPVQSNAWWKVHMQRTVSKPDLDEEDDMTDEPTSELHNRPYVIMTRGATVLSSTSSLVKTPPDFSRASSPTKLSRAGGFIYEPDSPTRPSRPGTSYFPFSQDDLPSVIQHSPPSSPTKEDEPSRWHCRSAISSTARGSSMSRSDTLLSGRSQLSPSRKPATQCRNAGRRQESIVEMEPLAEPAPARLPTELRIGVNPTMLSTALDKTSAPTSPTKRQLDHALFLAAPTVHAYGLLQPAFEVVETTTTMKTSSPLASRTNSERSARSATTTMSTTTTASEESHASRTTTTTTSSSKRSSSSSPRRRAALARRSPNKLRVGGEEEEGEEGEAPLGRAYTSPPLRARGGGGEAGRDDAFANYEYGAETSPQRARTAEGPAGRRGLPGGVRKLRTPAEKTRERMLALQSAQTMIEQGLLSRAAAQRDDL